MQDYLLADSAFYPVSALNRRSASLTLTQLKDHSAMSIELGCRGEPGAVFLVSSPRQFLYGAQGAGLVTSARILTDLHRLEGGGRKEEEGVAKSLKARGLEDRGPLARGYGSDDRVTALLKRSVFYE